MNINFQSRFSAQWNTPFSQTLRRGILTRQGGHPVRHWADELSSILLWPVAAHTNGHAIIFLLCGFFYLLLLSIFFLA